METKQRNDLIDSKKGIKDKKTSKKLAKLVRTWRHVLAFLTVCLHLFHCKTCCALKLQNKLDAFNEKSAKREPYTWGDEPEDHSPKIPAPKVHSLC